MLTVWEDQDEPVRELSTQGTRAKTARASQVWRAGAYGSPQYDIEH